MDSSCRNHDRLGSESWGAQRAIVESGQLLLILHAPPKPDTNEREHEVYFRQQDGKWLYKGLEHGDHALRKYLDEYRSLHDELETRFEKATDIFAGYVREGMGVVNAASSGEQTVHARQEVSPLINPGRHQPVRLRHSMIRKFGTRR